MPFLEAIKPDSARRTRRFSSADTDGECERRLDLFSILEHTLSGIVSPEQGSRGMCGNLGLTRASRFQLAQFFERLSHGLNHLPKALREIRHEGIRSGVKLLSASKKLKAHRDRRQWGTDFVMEAANHPVEQVAGRHGGRCSL